MKKPPYYRWLLLFMVIAAGSTHMFIYLKYGANVLFFLALSSVSLFVFPNFCVDREGQALSQYVGKVPGFIPLCFLLQIC